MPLPESTEHFTLEDAWRQIATMRNFLVHEYFNIDQAVVRRHHKRSRPIEHRSDRAAWDYR
jgi:uncharacterized protein with HEPN domain